MMIEAVPFFHILINIIQAEVGDDVSGRLSSGGAALTFRTPQWYRRP